MKVIRLTADRYADPRAVRTFCDWLTKKRARNDLPFSVVITDTEADEQYGVLIHCRDRMSRDAVLDLLRRAQNGEPVEPRRLEDVLYNQPIGKVFE